ncbi:MAG TPA: hypothetical protein VK473_03730 [Terriglobales bacterium]|nr:hypothetical protein [Terriglobales bacterium]
MPDLRGRALIESRFGKLGGGQDSVVIGDVEYDLPTLLARLDLGFEDSWPIDVQAVSEGHFCIRYYDGQDQRIVAHEFDSNFAFLAETRAHIAEWVGDDAYFQWFRSVPFCCLLIPGDDF